MYLVGFSASITLLTTALQLHNEYQRDIKGIEIQFIQIQDVHLRSLTQSLWATNSHELKVQLDGLIKIPNIIFTSVHTGEKLISQAGKVDSKNIISRQYQLQYFFLKQYHSIGNLTVIVTLDNIYNDLVRDAITIFVSNSIRTFLVVIFVFFIFYYLVTRHIIKISNYFEIYDPDVKDLLVLERSNLRSKDELDHLVASVNDMRLKMASQLMDINNQKQYLSIMLNSIGDAVIAVDVKGNVTRMNPVAERLTGWSFKHAKGQSLQTIFPIINATTRESIENPVDRVISTGEITYLSNHTTLISRDGTEYQIADSAAPIRNNDEILGVILIFNDVTEQYALREEASKSRRNLQSIMDNSPAVIYVKDINGRFTFINKQFVDLFNIKYEDIMGKTLHQIFPNDIADEMERNDKNVLTAGKALESEETAPQADGLHTYNSIKFPLRDSENNIYAICGISSDITDRKVKDEQLRRSQKMDALGKLTGGIAHDYNNMLGVILGYSELLESTLKGQTKAVDYVKEIRHAGERGALLTKKLLSFTRNISTANKIIDLNSLLCNTRHMLEKTLTVRIYLDFQLDQDLWPVFLDESDLEDAVLNICINAMHAIQDNGKLTLKTVNESLDQSDAEQIHVEAGDYVLLSFTDTGCGMDQETKERIFDPFFSTKGEKGTGLGLSQVYGLVQRSKGAIKVISEPRLGTCITMYFPRHIGLTTLETSPPVEKIINTHGNETILIVDDEPALVKLTSQILANHGYQILTAFSGKEALEILEKSSVDVLFSDVIMPEMDGYQLVSIVQKKYPNIKVQLASGFSDTRHVGLTDESVHNNLLHKPYHSKTLLNRMRKLLS